jgi:hypothetical protein
MADFHRWVLASSPSDFNLVTINRQYVVVAQRIKHGENGVSVTIRGHGEPLVLTASFDEFDEWLNEAPPKQAKP